MSITAMIEVIYYTVKSFIRMGMEFSGSPMKYIEMSAPRKVTNSH